MCPSRMRVVSMPQPMSTPTRLGTTLLVMVIVVPMVQPLPAWMSGISRIRLPAVNSWLHSSCTWAMEALSTTSVKILASLYFPRISIIKVLSVFLGPRAVRSSHTAGRHPARLPINPTRSTKQWTAAAHRPKHQRWLPPDLGQSHQGRSRTAPPLHPWPSSRK